MNRPALTSYILPRFSILALLSLVLYGCGGGTSSSTAQNSNTQPSATIDFDYQLAAVHRATPANVGRNAQTTVAPKSTTVPFNGTMVMTNQATGEVTREPWYLNINPGTMQAASLKTIVLVPGSYAFEIKVASGNRQYIGTGTHEVKAGEAATLPLTLSPVLQGVDTDLVDISEYIRLQFALDTLDIEDLATLTLTIETANGQASAFDVNPNTGQAGVYLYLDSTETYNIRLLEYNQVIAKSKLPVALTPINQGDFVDIDLIPIYAETAFAFVGEGLDELTLTFNIPEMVITEGGDAIKTLLKYTYKGEAFEREVSSITQTTSGTYQAAITLTGIYDGSISVSLEFYDGRDERYAWVNAYEVDLGEGAASAEPISITQSNAVFIYVSDWVGVNLLSVLAVNVFDEHGQPQEGAEIFVDDAFQGLTGAGAFGTPGYLKTYLKRGEYTITARVSSTHSAEATMTVAALDIINLDLNLTATGTPPPSQAKKVPFPLNDTGITWSGNYPDGNNTTCAGSDITGIDAPQDCDQGRDALAASSTLEKVGAGAAGFDFTKLDMQGNDLPASAPEWRCVRDNHTGLIWEVKTTDGGIHDKDNRYQWGGKTALGREHPDREGKYYDEWNELIDGANGVNGEAPLCGITEWRVPKREELRSIVDYGRSNPAIDTDYFPNTVSRSYWSASPYAGYSGYAWLLHFYDGYDDGNGRYAPYRVRLVASNQ